MSDPDDLVTLPCLARIVGINRHRVRYLLLRRLKLEPRRGPDGRPAWPFRETLPRLIRAHVEAPRRPRAVAS